MRWRRWFQKRWMLQSVIAISILTTCILLLTPGWRYSSHRYKRQDKNRDLLYVNCSTCCSHSFSSLPMNLHARFVDVVTSPDYPASRAPQVNGHFLPEEEVTCIPGATTLDGVAYGNTSTLTILGDTNVFILGSEVRVRVDVYTRGGVQKHYGGDGVRVWLRDRKNNANAAGYVVDLGNGSYLGVLRAMWAGKAEVVAAIATPLEQIQLMYRLYASRGTLRELFGVFVDKVTNQKEDTWCFPFSPNLTSTGAQTCNLTEWNYGMSWHCQKPASLGCQHFRGVAERRFGPLPLSALELALPAHFHLPVSQTINITVTTDAGESVVRATTPCHQRPWAESFVDATPVGFFFRGSWHLSHCDVRASSSLLAYSPCLQNKTLYLFGDSTMRQVFDHLVRPLHLTLSTPKPTRSRRNLPAVGERADWNFTVLKHIHGMPYYGGYGEPVTFHLDAIPSETNGIVLIGLYQHFTPYHPRVFRERVRSVARAVERLVKRAAGVDVAVRGSHQFSRRLLFDAPFSHDDYWGKLYDRVWKEGLFHLRDRVVFLDTWDMTLGAESLNPHPPPAFQDALLQSLLGFTCRRKFPE